MTPARLKELRAHATSEPIEGREQFIRGAIVLELLDHVEAQEKALQAADKMRVELGKRNWSQMSAAEMEYDAAREATL